MNFESRGGVKVSPARDRDATYPGKPAAAEHAVHPIIAERWSPRLFEKREVEQEKIASLLEAARWAPSSSNEQPWRYLVWDGSDPEARAKANSCLARGNAWALEAPLLMLSVSSSIFAKTGKPNRHGQHDVGLASENVVLQAVALGLAAHQMAGYDPDKARELFNIPEEFTPMAMIAAGYPFRGDLSSLSEAVQKRELAERTRKPLAEIAFDGTWNRGYGAA